MLNALTNNARSRFSSAEKLAIGRPTPLFGRAALKLAAKPVSHRPAVETMAPSNWASAPLNAAFGQPAVAKRHEQISGQNADLLHLTAALLNAPSTAPKPVSSEF